MSSPLPSQTMHSVSRARRSLQLNLRLRASWTPRLRALLCVLAIAVGIPALHADAFQAGIEAYHNGEYATAQAQFRAAVQAHETAAARHNLGLSHIQLDAPAAAVWQLERAQLLAPFNSEYRFKLAALRQQLGLSAGTPPWYAQAAELLPSRAWLVLACSSFWVLLAACLLPRGSNRRAGIRIKSLRALCLLGLLAALPSLAVHRGRLQSGTVVASEMTRLHAAPASAAPQSGSARPGERGRIVDQHNDFYAIETESQASGWIAKQAFRALSD